MEKRDGGPAWPSHDYLVGDISKDKFQKLGETRGMSLRDYFAGQALPDLAECSGLTPEQMARRCYEIADAMLAERSKDA